MSSAKWWPFCRGGDELMPAVCHSVGPACFSLWCWPRRLQLDRCKLQSQETQALPGESHWGRWLYKHINSLTLGRWVNDFKIVIIKLILPTNILRISSEIALWRMPQNPLPGKSTLVQVMAWCRQATSHYLSQCWPRSMSPNGVTRPQCVKKTITLLSKYARVLHSIQWQAEQICKQG